MCGHNIVWDREEISDWKENYDELNRSTARSSSCFHTLGIIISLANNLVVYMPYC